MKRKKDNGRELSLLENPSAETQSKDNSFKIIIRAIVISLLLSLLVFGYIVKFSANSFPQWVNVKYTGTFKASNFCNVDDFDMVIVKPYKNIIEAKVGDIVCFANTIEKGSGEIVGFQGNIIEIKINDVVKRVSKNSIVGKQIKTVPYVGLLIEFIGSYYGIALFNILLLLYVLHLTFSRVNYENTNKGRFLYNKFRAEQKEKKNSLKIQKQLKGLNGVTFDVLSILDGDYSEKAQKLHNFNGNSKMDIKQKYKYVLRVIHDAYIIKEELDRNERRHISGLVELMFESKDIDNDIEYMLIDLMLKASLFDFDDKTFSASMREFLTAKHDDDDLLNLGSVLYVLVLKNKKYREDLKEICDEYLQKAQYLDRKEKDLIFPTALSIVSLLK